MQHRIEQVQSILIPKNKFPHEHQAIKEVERMGLNAKFKLHPHETQNYWRFRQHNPMDNAQYTTRKLHSGIKEVVQASKSNHMVGYKDKITGEQHGIWKPEYRKQAEKPVHVPEMINIGKNKYDLNRKRVL